MSKAGPSDLGSCWPPRMPENYRGPFPTQLGWRSWPMDSLGLGPGSPQTGKDLPSNLAGVGDHRGQIFVAALGSCGRRGFDGSKKLPYAYSRCCDVLRSALGPSFLVILRRFGDGRWGAGGFGGVQIRRSPPHRVAERALEGLRSWLEASGGVDFGGFRGIRKPMRSSP